MRASRFGMGAREMISGRNPSMDRISTREARGVGVGVRVGVWVGVSVAVADAVGVGDSVFVDVGDGVGWMIVIVRLLGS